MHVQRNLLVCSVLLLQVIACGSTKQREACFATVENEHNKESDRLLDSGACKGHKDPYSCPAWLSLEEKYDQKYMDCP